jgi:peptide/nickel transport system permease protein
LVRYIAQRLLQIILTFFLFLALSYMLLEAMPGDFSQLFLQDPKLTPDQREAIAASLGLDRPPHERFFRYIGSFLRGDLGVSFQYYPRPVVDVILERAPRTLMLFISSTVVSFYVGFFVGKLLAWRRGRVLEYVTTVGGVTLYTVFTPWFGLLMIWLFAFTLDWFPIGKFITPRLWRDAPVEANVVFNRMLLTALVVSLVLLTWFVLTRRIDTRWRRVARWGGIGLGLAVVLGIWGTSGLGPYALNILHHLMLPVLTLTLISFAGTMLLTRNSMLETLREDYITTARAKGLPEKVIRDKHAARNAMLPVVTSLVFSLAFALSGGVITEGVFSWPGMGEVLLTSAVVQDIPMMMGALIFTAIFALLAHLVVDILYAFLDPRIRYG